MASSLAGGEGRRFLRIFGRLTIHKGTTARPGRFFIESKANPATCTRGELNVGTDGKLYVCSATNTWTVAGTQV